MFMLLHALSPGSRPPSLEAVNTILSSMLPQLTSVAHDVPIRKRAVTLSTKVASPPEMLADITALLAAYMDPILCGKPGVRITEVVNGKLSVAPELLEVLAPPVDTKVFAGVDKALTMSTGSFTFTADDTRVEFPPGSGPITVFSKLIVPSSACSSMYWALTMSGNSSWCIGVQPESDTAKNYLYTRASVGLNNSGISGGVLTPASMHGKPLQIVVDAVAANVSFYIDGRLHITQPIPASMFPVRLAVLGFHGTAATFRPKEPCLASSV